MSGGGSGSAGGLYILAKWINSFYPTITTTTTTTNDARYKPRNIYEHVIY